MGEDCLAKHREALNEFEQVADNFINESLELLKKNFSDFQLQCLDCVFSNKRFNVDVSIGKYSNSQVVSRKKSLCNQISIRLNLDQESDFDSLINVVSALSSEPYAFLEKRKLELLSLYTKYCDYLWHISPIISLCTLKASMDQKNMYSTELCNAVFATSSYWDILRYIGRAACGSMCVIANGRFCLYNQNPFVYAENGLMTLKKSVGVYRVNPNMFEPVFDFLYTNEKSNSLKFGHEWIARSNYICCKNEVIKQISFTDLSESCFYYGVNNTDIQAVCDKCNELMGEKYIEKYLDELTKELAIQRIRF